MENNRNEEQQSRQNISGEKNSVSRNFGFEGMNFEQQRGSYKNSDGAGVGGRSKTRNGKSAPDEKE